MSEISSGTVLITGSTGGLGRSATMAMANRPKGERPGLLLVGRPGQALHDVRDEARAAGATVHEIGCDLASLADVRAAAATVNDLLRSRAVRPLRGLVAIAGLLAVDTRSASADGYELTFAVNYLAHAQLIDDLLDSFTTPARVVLVGSGTYYANWVRRLMMVPTARWTDPLEIAKPAGSDVPPTQKAAGVAYSNSKLAILYYAHELQRRGPKGSAWRCSSLGSCPARASRGTMAPGFSGWGEGCSDCLSPALPRL